jgi:hypothetical protein
MQAKTAVCRAVEDYLVFVHSEDSPSNAEWSQLMDQFRHATNLRRIRVLVFTYGGAPNARQRVELNDVLRDIRPPVAVVTPSTLARAVCTAIGWFNPRIRPFTPEEIELAFDYLDANQADRKVLVRMLTEMRLELGHTSAAPPPASFTR